MCFILAIINILIFSLKLSKIKILIYSYQIEFLRDFCYNHVSSLLTVN